MTHTLTLAFGTTGDVMKAVPLTVQAEQNIDVSIPSTTTDLHAIFNLLIAQMTDLFIVSDKDVTIQTNDGTSPDDTITLLADKPFCWYLGCGIANPITADITDLYITNAGGAAALVKIRSGYDATP